MNMFKNLVLALVMIGFGGGLQAASGAPAPVALPASGQSSLAMGPGRAIVATELNLYGLLQIVTTNIDRQSKQLMTDTATNAERLTMLGAAFQLAVESMKLFSAVVDGFNNGGFYYNPELKYRFVTVCNVIDIRNPIEPRHLRQLSDQVKRFCRQVKAYSNSHKGFLSKEDNELSDKIINLGNALTSGLLRDEFFSIDWADKVVDWSIYRPAEFMRDNKELLITVGVVSVAVLAAWWWRSGSNDHEPVIPSANPANAVVGLRNADGIFLPSTANNCWANASLQCLFRASSINDSLPGKRPLLAMRLQDPNALDGAVAIQSYGNVLTNLNTSPVALAPFHHAIRNAYFNGQSTGRQQDATEFITGFFGDLRRQLDINPFSVPTHEDRAYGQCPTCLRPAEHRQAFPNPDEMPTSLALTIPAMVNKNPTLQDCLRPCFAPSARDVNHPVCGHAMQATYATQLDAYPDLLVISLNRFVAQPILDNQGHQVMRMAPDSRTGGQRPVEAMDMVKLQTPVVIPEQFDLATCCGAHHPVGNGQYDLVGMIEHGGENTESGHYVAVTRRAEDGSWYYFSDEHVYPIANIHDILDAGVHRDDHYQWTTRRGRFDPVPYVLFYVRRPDPTTASDVKKPVVQPRVLPATGTTTGSQQMPTTPAITDGKAPSSTTQPPLLPRATSSVGKKPSPAKASVSTVPAAPTRHGSSATTTTSSVAKAILTTAAATTNPSVATGKRN